MTIVNVSSGQIIDPDWGNDVTDKLNGIVAGQAVETSDANGIISVSFGVTFASPPIVTATRETGATTGEKGGHFDEITTTGFDYRCFDGGSRQNNVSNITVHWIAVGVLA